MKLNFLITDVHALKYDDVRYDSCGGSYKDETMLPYIDRAASFKAEV